MPESNLMLQSIELLESETYLARQAYKIRTSKDVSDIYDLLGESIRQLGSSHPVTQYLCIKLKTTCIASDCNQRQLESAVENFARF